MTSDQHGKVQPWTRHRSVSGDQGGAKSKSGEKIKCLSSEPSEKREGHFSEQYHDWVFLWPTQHLKKQLLPL